MYCVPGPVLATENTLDKVTVFRELPAGEWLSLHEELRSRQLLSTSHTLSTATLGGGYYHHHGIQKTTEAQKSDLTMCLESQSYQ